MTLNRIIHADSTIFRISDVLAGRKIDCIVTDPPFGVDFVSRRATTPEGKKLTRAINGDADLKAARLIFRQAMANLKDDVADECELYMFTRWDIVSEWIDELRFQQLNGFKYKMMLIWDKGYPGQGDIDCNWGCGHEIILYAKRGRREVNYRRSGIIHVDKLPTGKHIHPTEKPWQLMAKLIEMSTDPGDLVVDPFSGSGSSSVAAQRLGRDSVAFETDPEFHAKSSARLDQTLLF